MILWGLYGGACPVALTMCGGLCDCNCLHYLHSELAPCSELRSKREIIAYPLSIKFVSKMCQLYNKNDLNSTINVYLISWKIKIKIDARHPTISV